MVSWWVATAASVGAGAALVAALHIRSRRRPAVRSWWQGVEVRPSRIDGAGDGLFTTRRFVVGEVLGLYYGRVLSLVEATRLSNRDYLMGGFGLNAHVDVRAASRLALPSRLPQALWPPRRRASHSMLPPATSTTTSTETASTRAL